MLEAVDLRCERGERLLFDGLEFKLEPGALLRVAGTNGSGKTSLLRVVCGLALPARGEVLWHGEPIRTLREDYHRQLLYIGHSHALKDELTAEENLRLSCALSGEATDGARLAAALERMGLEHCAMLPARHLSQGQRRRAALARLAASAATPLWILDEPFTALDAAAIECVQALIAKHVEAGGMAIFTSHQEVMVAAITTLTVELGG